MSTDEFAIGDRVRIERDERLYPSKGTWPRLRGKTGTVVEVNTDEFGVCFSRVTVARPSARRAYNWDASAVAWFKAYEMCPLPAERERERTNGTRRDYDLAGAV